MRGLGVGRGPRVMGWGYGWWSMRVGCKGPGVVAV